MEYGTHVLGLRYHQRRRKYEIAYIVLQSPLKIAQMRGYDMVFCQPCHGFTNIHSLRINSPCPSFNLPWRSSNVSENPSAIPPLRAPGITTCLNQADVRRSYRKADERCRVTYAMKHFPGSSSAALMFRRAVLSQT